MATSIGAGFNGGGDLPHNPIDILRSARAVETAVGVGIGFIVAGGLAYLFQHYLQFRSGRMSGRILEWCPTAPTPHPISGRVVAVGAAGPGAGGVYSTPGAAETWSLTVPPGLYALAVILADGRQVPAMVLTPQTAAGVVALPSSLELIYDVSAQAIMPESGSLTVDLVVSC